MIQNFIDYVIRPKRKTYNPAEDLGDQTFLVDNVFYCERKDFDVKNKQNLTLKCSLFHRAVDKDMKYPLIVYCHGNSGSRIDSRDAIYTMLRMNIFVLAFDFAGCGVSEGNYVSLGYYEQGDIRSIFDYLENHFDFIDKKRIGLWGRSMGAVSSILFAATYHKLCFLVLDSPFEDLSILLKEYIDKFKILSKIAGKYVYKNLKSKIIEQAGFNFEEVSPIEVINNCKAAMLFLHGTKDSIVPIHHSKKLFDKYTGDKSFLEIKGGHNDRRPDKAFEYISNFVVEQFTSEKKFDEEIESQDIKKGTRNHSPNSFSKPTFNHIRVEGEIEENDVEDNSPDIVPSQPFQRRTHRRALFYRPQTIYIKEDDIIDVDTKGVSIGVFAGKTLAEFPETPKSKHPESVVLTTRRLTMTVCKSDAEEMTNMMNIFEELKENVEDSDQANTGDDDQMAESKFRISTKRDDENLGEDGVDSGLFRKKSDLQPFIHSAAESNFELFRKKKSFYNAELRPSINTIGVIDPN